MTEVINGVSYTVIDSDNYDTYKNQIGNYDSVTGIDGAGSDSTLPNTANKTRFTKSAWILHGSPANVYIKNFEILEEGCFKDTNVVKVYIGNTVRNQNGGTPLDASLVAVGRNCFKGATSLNSVIFEDYTGGDGRAITVEAFAFEDTSSLTTLTFPKRLLRLFGSALKKATGLTSLIFDGISEGGAIGTNASMLVEIGSSALEGCSSLTSIEIPKSVTTLGSSAFKDCIALSQTTFPDGSGVTIIQGYAFQNTALTSFEIPASVTELEKNAWKDIDVLTELTFHEDTAISILGTRSLEAFNISQVDADGHRTFIVPDTVTQIGSNFLKGSNVTRVIFEHQSTPPNLTIHEDAFDNSSVTVINGETQEVLNAISLPSGVSITKEERYPPAPPICFPKGTPVSTDQGIIAIEKLNTDKHTIRGKEIVAITQTRPLQKHIVCFEKNSLNKNVPSQQTLCSMEHKVFYKGEMMKARDIVDICEKVTFIDYNGETLYNVLLKKHDKMMINNLICETLHPKNIMAKISTMKDGKKKSKVIRELTKIIKENNIPEYQKLYASL